MENVNIKDEVSKIVNKSINIKEKGEEIITGDDVHSIARGILNAFYKKLGLHRKEELRKEFVKMFKMHPENVTINEAIGTLAIPRDLTKLASEILEACDRKVENPENCKIVFRVKRDTSSNSDYDWQIDKQQAILKKRKNGFVYIVQLTQKS